ncbi:hypothetical protein V7S43_000325 [Phytophthora oleae]|uniref:Uncharacterized protein n=1 Tax=Phytophthora oleae TaxID=2107226 RepID=A0ABD3G7C1_9STRA
MATAALVFDPRRGHAAAAPARRQDREPSRLVQEREGSVVYKIVKTVYNIGDDAAT